MRRARFPARLRRSLHGVHSPGLARGVPSRCQYAAPTLPLRGGATWPGTLPVASGHFSLKTMILNDFFKLEFGFGLRHYIVGNKQGVSSMKAINCIAVASLLALLLAGCTTPVTVLKNNRTGAVVTCGGETSGSLAGGAIGYNMQKSKADKCVGVYKAKGYHVVK